MYRMDKLTTGIAYGTSAGNAGFWMLQLLDKVSPSQWAAIGVLGSPVSYTHLTLPTIYSVEISVVAV